jgi:hypothetical protein
MAKRLQRRDAAIVKSETVDTASPATVWRQRLQLAPLSHSRMESWISKSAAAVYAISMFHRILSRRRRDGICKAQKSLR